MCGEATLVWLTLVWLARTNTLTPEKLHMLARQGQEVGGLLCLGQGGTGRGFVAAMQARSSSCAVRNAFHSSDAASPLSALLQSVWLARPS